MSRTDIETQYERNLKSLDGLIATFGVSDNASENESARGLLVEHLQAARRDLLGSMPNEYALSVRLAEESVRGFSNKVSRTEVTQILRSLIRPEES